MSTINISSIYWYDTEYGTTTTKTILCLVFTFQSNLNRKSIEWKITPPKHIRLEKSVTFYLAHGCDVRASE